MKVMLQWKARNILEKYDTLHSESDFLDFSKFKKTKFKKKRKTKKGENNNTESSKCKK